MRWRGGGWGGGKGRGDRSYRALRPGDRPVYFQFKCNGKPLQDFKGAVT